MAFSFSFLLNSQLVSLPELLPTHPPPLAASNPAVVVVPAKEGGTRPDL